MNYDLVNNESLYLTNIPYGATKNFSYIFSETIDFFQPPIFNLLYRILCVIKESIVRD